MFETRELLRINFHEFDKYFSIFEGLQILYKPGSTMTMKESLNNAYRLYIYEKPNPKFRGLPEQDEDGTSKPLPETHRGYDSSDADVEEEERKLMIDLKIDELSM